MAVHRAIGGRDPFAYPRLESDDDYVGKRASQVSLTLWFSIKCLEFIDALEKI